MTDNAQRLLINGPSSSWKEASRNCHEVLLWGLAIQHFINDLDEEAEDTFQRMQTGEMTRLYSPLQREGRKDLDMLERWAETERMNRKKG